VFVAGLKSPLRDSAFSFYIFLYTIWIYKLELSVSVISISYQYQLSVSVISKGFNWDANAYHLETICGAFGFHLATKGVHLVFIWCPFVLHLVRILVPFEEDGKICGDL